MSKRKPKLYNAIHLIEAIEKWPVPLVDKKHNLTIYVEGQARSNQTRLEHIVQHSHDLKERDLDNVPAGITNYVVYKKDPVYKDTYNYYINRRGKDRGFIKVSIQIDRKNKKRAWIKTIYITYRIKTK